jgi:hypothetical protein
VRTAPTDFAITIRTHPKAIPNIETIFQYLPDFASRTVATLLKNSKQKCIAMMFLEALMPINASSPVVPIMEKEGLTIDPAATIISATIMQRMNVRILIEPKKAKALIIVRSNCTDARNVTLGSTDQLTDINASTGNKTGIKYKRALLTKTGKKIIK